MFELIEFIKIMVLSFIQGITEWLPISSTGHLRLFNEIMPLNLNTEFVDLFMILVQLGSIFAVIVLYFNKLNPLSPSKTIKEQKDTWSLWGKVIVGSVPAFAIGLPLDKYMDEYFNTPFVIATTLILYGIAFIWIESERKPKHAFEIRNFE